jgi:hypothetical protein
MNFLPQVEWKDGCSKELHSAIADRLNDMIGTYLRRATNTAIFEPNTLEFSLPMNYDLERKALERPETVARLESIAAELVKKPVRIQFRTAAAVEPASKPVSLMGTANRNQIVEDPEDPYLLDVMKTLGVKSWVVKEQVVEATEVDPSPMGSE